MSGTSNLIFAVFTGLMPKSARSKVRAGRRLNRANEEQGAQRRKAGRCDASFGGGVGFPTKERLLAPSANPISSARISLTDVKHLIIIFLVIIVACSP